MSKIRQEIRKAARPEKERKAYAHWLHGMTSIGPRTIERLLTVADPKTLYTIPQEAVEGLLTAKQREEFLTSRERGDVIEQYARVEKAGITFLTKEDAHYPARLKSLKDAPYGLYCLGTLPADAQPTVAIIGARMCSEYGRYMARLFGTELAAAGVQVISGMALGIDGIAQKGALAAGGKSFGILGCGVDVCYPEENRALYEELLVQGGVLSEYVPGTMPEAKFFPQRNRIIAGLADIVLVIEARKKSGTLITVDQALDYGRDVYAVPGRVTDRLSDGCNHLIRQGAGIAFSPADVLEAIYGTGMESGAGNGDAPANQRDSGNATPVSGGERRLTLSPLEEALLGIVDIEPVSVNTLHGKLADRGIQATVPTLMNTLVTMCLKGFLFQEGGYFCRRLGA